MKHLPLVLARLMFAVSVAATVGLPDHPAWAHAFLDRASPPVGSQVAASPPSLSLRYSEPVEPLFSTVQVTNDKGERVDDGKPVPKDDDRVLEVKLKPLPPGAYHVEWHVTSVDTHKTEGHFTFTVQP
ncbi:MAG TPA: copper resistance protein CopC [Rhodopila sp.]|nr:copper resistance protein CopC [Rhodopila sp.]